METEKSNRSESLGKDLPILTANLTEVFEETSRQLSKALLLAKPILEGFNKQFVNDFKLFHQFVEEHNRKLKIPIGILSEHGWYVSSEMTSPDTIKLASQIEQGQIDKVDKWMVSFYKSQIEGIEERLVSQYPNRQLILKSAFRAHRRREYVLSIPVLLAQADGVCKEAIGIGFFSKEAGSPKTARFAEDFATDSFLSSILEPLRRSSVVSANTWDIPDPSGKLNRHGILHGSIIDYANEVNGYKSISLLDYLSDFVLDAAKGKEPPPESKNHETGSVGKA